MGGPTHTAVAFAFAGTVVATTWGNPEVLGLPVMQLLLLPTAVAGGLKADIDMKNNRQFGSGVASKLFTHRGFTHTGIVLAAIYGLAYLINSASDANMATIILNSLILGFFLGYFSHIYIDLFNYKGCPVFWPIFPNRMHITCVTTGSGQEPVFMGIAVIMLVVHSILVLGGVTL